MNNFGNVYHSFSEMAAGTGALQPPMSQMSVFNLGISYANDEISDQCTANTQTQMRLLGKDKANALDARLSELRAANTLAELVYATDYPGRYHPMEEGDRAKRGELTCDISNKERLVFTPATPPPIMPNGLPDYRKVTDVVLVGIDDTHHN